MRSRAVLSASVAASLLSLLVLSVLGSPPASAQDGGMELARQVAVGGVAAVAGHKTKIFAA